MYLHVPGVLWTGLESVVPGAQEVVKYLRHKVLTLRCSVDNTSDFQFDRCHCTYTELLTLPRYRCCHFSSRLPLLRMNVALLYKHHATIVDILTLFIVHIMSRMNVYTKALGKYLHPR